MRQRWFLIFLAVAALPLSLLAQDADLRGRVADAMNDVKAKRYEKAAELRGLGEKVFPYLDEYVNDPSEEVRREVVALLRRQTSPAALKILARALEYRELEIADRAAEIVHDEYTCAQLAASGRAKAGLKAYLGRRPRSARAVLLLSCFGDDPEVVKLLASKRKELGTHEDGGVHHDVPFNLSVEMALAATGDLAAVSRVRDYIGGADSDNLFFIFDNVKFVRGKELHLALVELLKDKRPTYEPISHSDFSLRVCDLALTALTSTDPLPITANYEKQRSYTDEELEAAYTRLKAQFEKEAK